MKDEHCCEKCAQNQEDELEKIISCKLLTPNEKASIIEARRITKLADDFARKYVMRSN
jgi:hypothetical protein